MSEFLVEKLEIIEEEKDNESMDGDRSSYYSQPSGDEKKSDVDLFSKSDEEYESDGEDGDDEMCHILQRQLDQVQREKEWSKAAIQALRVEMADGDESKSEESTQPIGECGWYEFLYEWRQKFGEWGKRALDVRQCEGNDRQKACHLLIEMYRRRRSLASCKAHIEKLLQSGGETSEKEIVQESKSDGQEEESAEFEDAAEESC